MRSLVLSFLGYFLTPSGLVALGVLDSSMVFFLPLGIDFVVILMAARNPSCSGSMPSSPRPDRSSAPPGRSGSGEESARTAWRVRQGFAAQARAGARRTERGGDRRALAIIPPPFPFTAFVLTSGACQVNAWTFFVTLAGVRALRFGAKARSRPTTEAASSAG